MATCKIQFAGDGYRVEIDGAQSEISDFGEILEFETGGKRYLAFVDLPDGGDEGDEAESLLADGWMYECKSVEAEQEDIEDDLDEEAGDDDEEDEEVVVEEGE